MKKSEVPPEKRDGRKENAAVTQAALRTAGRRLFGTQGYDATAIGKLCAEARVTTGALYHHFGDKKGLFAAIVEEIDAELVAHATAAGHAVVARGGSLWEGFLATVDVVLEAGAAPEGRRIMLTDAPAVLGGAAWEAIRERQGLGAMTRLVEALQKQNLLRKDDPKRLARIVLGMLYGAIESLPEDSRETRNALTQSHRLIHAMLHALRVDPPT